jgi:hypothetical protein
MEAEVDSGWQDINWAQESRESEAATFYSTPVEGWEVVDISRESGDESFAPQATEREGDWQLHSADKHSDDPRRLDTPGNHSHTTNNDVLDDDIGEIVEPSASPHSAKSVSTAGLQPHASSPCTIASVTNHFEVTCAMPGFFQVTPPEKTKPRPKPIKHHSELIGHEHCPLIGEGKIMQERPFVAR